MFVWPDFELAPPPELAAVPADSILIRNQGGTLTLSGVTAKMAEVPVSFKVGARYLLFVRFDDNIAGKPTRFAHMSLGSAAAFGYNDETEQFSTLSRDPDEK